FAGGEIKAMQLAPTIRDEDQSLGNRRSGENVAIQPIRPKFSGRGDVTLLRRVDALEPRFILSPEQVAAASYVQAAFVEDRHAVHVAWAFASIAVEAMHVRLRRAGIEIELEDFFEF